MYESSSSSSILYFYLSFTSYLLKFKSLELLTPTTDSVLGTPEFLGSSSPKAVSGLADAVIALSVLSLFPLLLDKGGFKHCSL